MHAARLSLVALLLVLPELAAAKPVAPPSLADLVAKNAAAKGGLDKLRALSTVQRSGQLIGGGGQWQLDYVETLKRGANGTAIRVDVTLQGLTSIDAWDGQGGWRVNPFMGRKDAERMSLEDAKGLILDADIEGPLIDADKKGHTLVYAGREDVDGTLAHKIIVTRKDGDVQTVYVEPNTFLEIRIVTRRLVRGALDESVVDFGDYMQIGGVLLPFWVQAGSKSSSDRIQVEFTHGGAGFPLDDAVFRFPAQGTQAPPPPLMRDVPAVPPSAPTAQAPDFDAGTISGLGARNIGSAAMSGRIAAIAATPTPDGKTTLFIGAASGGVWKSLDGGTTFRPVFDDQPVQSIGALAIDPTNPQVVWAGTGESWTRNSVSIGDGVYRSGDGGETWQHMGLAASERITRIEVDPRDGNVVWVCAPGRLWSDGGERGLYQTRDGGKTWRLALAGKNGSTGCGSLSLDPRNPDVVWASLWDFRRKGWTFRSGGDGPQAPSGSGLFRSADGGKSFTEVTPAANPGFGKPPYGRIAVAVAPSRSERLYAFVESTDSALYVSDDAGKTWEARDRSQWMVWRPFYFGHLVVDPTNPDRVFKMDGNLILSEDAGRSFAVVGGFAGMHGDLHDLWVDPRNPKQVIAGDDGGLWFAHDGGSKWWKCDNLPISQFYHVAVDDADPYRVYGGLQDNDSWVGESEYPGGITSREWKSLYWGDGFAVLPDPSDGHYVYAEAQGGFVARVNRDTHEARDIQPKAGYHEKLRWNWNTPLALSPSDPKAIYIGAQFLFRSRDQGSSWERLSPDLTSNDPDKQRQDRSGGVTVDNSAAEMHTTITAIAESPVDASVLWAGTDDGNLQVTRDGGKTWRNVAPRIAGLPPASWVTSVEASRHGAGTAYVTFDRHTFGDMAPYLYVTRDFGETWKPLLTPGASKGVRGYTHIVRQDPVEPGLLFVGSELGLSISVDDGARFAPYQGGRFPAVAVRDIAIAPRQNDLVLGTHGRGIWVVDDISPLRDLARRERTRAAGAKPFSSLRAPVVFLESNPAMQRISGPGGWPTGAASFVGENPPDGALVTYHQAERHMFGRMKIEVLDPAGNVIDELPAGKRRGVNRVLWSMRTRAPRVPRAVQLARWATSGPRVVPDTYTLRVTRGSETYETKIAVVLDGRATYTVADRRANFDAAMKLHALFGDESVLVERVNALRRELADRIGKAPAPLRAELQRLDEQADLVRKLVVATTEGGAITGEERLREHTDMLYGVFLQSEGRPGSYQLARIDVLRRELTDAENAFSALLADELPRLNPSLERGGLTPIEPPKAAQLPEDSPERTHWLQGLGRKQKKSKDLDSFPATFRLY